MLNNLYACVIFYNDTVPIFERCLKSLKATGLKVIAIDGAFQEFPRNEEESFGSTDGCFDLALEYADYVVKSPHWGWVDQAQKRNIYTKIVPIGSYMLIIDADEEIVPFDGFEAGFNLSEPNYDISIKVDSSPSLCYATRVFKVFADTAYLYTHCRLYRQQQHNPGRGYHTGLIQSAGNLLKDKNGSPMLIIHNNRMRPEGRQEQDRWYMINRREKNFLNMLMAKKMGKSCENV